MGVTLGVITAIIYCGFYLHDRTVLVGTAYEASVWGAQRERIDGTGGALTADAAKELAAGRYLFYREPVYAGSSGRGKVTTQAKGSERLPDIGVLALVLKDREWADGYAMECTCIRPETLIRRSRILFELKE